MSTRTTFISERHFVIHDYFTSHNQLLLRSLPEIEHGKNIDIIFFDVKLLYIPSQFYGIKIEPEIVPFDFPSKDRYNFKLTTQGEKFKITASFVRIYENDLAYNCTSLGVLKHVGRTKEIYSLFL